MSIPSVFIIPKEKGVTFRFHLITVTQTHERAGFLFVWVEGSFKTRTKSVETDQAEIYG